MAENVFLSWSGGKDSALALEKLLYRGDTIVEGIFSICDPVSRKIPVHSIAIELIELQAKSLGLRFFPVFISENSPNEEYAQKIKDFTFRNQINAIAFGDIHLEEIKKFRDELGARFKFKTIYPLWGKSTEEIAAEIIGRGFKSRICAVDQSKLNLSFLGREYDEELVADLPDGIDISGENGEFHTFTYDGPIFSKPVNIKNGQISQKNEQYVNIELLNIKTNN